jgi:hypothetical protein
MFYFDMQEKSERTQVSKHVLAIFLKKFPVNVMKI